MLQRVSNPMMQQMMLSDMQNNLARLLELNQQIATQKKFSKPSDNPIDVTRSMAMGTAITENTQYQRNINDGVTWLQNTESTFNQITNVYQQIRQLAVYAGDGGLEGVDMGAIAEQISQLQEEMRNAANYEVEGLFLLSGLSTGVRPFVRDASGKVIYQGSTDYVQFEMGRQDVGQVSFTGRDLFPVDDKQYTLRSIEVGMDFLWKGRDEILQLQVGNQTVKARLPEKWQDEKVDNVADSGDFNRYRDPAELEGYTLDDIAKALNESMDMGNFKRLVSVSVEKDEARGVQRLVVKSHNGQPVRLTTWPETDEQKLAQGIQGTGQPIAGAFTADSDATMTVDFGNGVTYDVAVAGKTVTQIADELRKVPGIWADRKQDGPPAVNEWIDAVARTPGTSFKIHLTGNVRDLFGSVDTVSSEAIAKNTDHSHIDLGRLLGVETALKSTEVPTNWVKNTTPAPAGTGALHWKFQSGDRKAEVFINGDPDLTVEELATQINAVMGNWLEAIVETDAPDGTNPTPDPLGNSGSNAEAPTKRLVLRTLDGSPLVVYDGEKAGAGTGDYARQLGVETTLRGEVVPPLRYPSDGVGGPFDENMPALMNVQVGDRTFVVKACALRTPTALDVANAIVSQVNQQAGTKLLDVDALTGAANGPFALLSLTGEPVRITDRGYGDPAFSTFTGGIAQQLGIQAGVRGGTLGGVGNITRTDTVGSLGGAAGTLRLSSLGRTVDVSVLAGDTLKDLTDRIRSLTGDWLDVSYFDPAMASNPASEVSLSLAAKDGSPLTIYDVTGDGARLFQLDTALQGGALAAWVPVANDQLTLTVNGVSHTIDLFDESAGTPTANGLEELAALINTRFQAQDLRAETVDLGGGNRKLVLTSPRGYGFTVDESGLAAGSRLGIAAFPPGTAVSPTRGGSGPFNQRTTVRTAANQTNQDFFGTLDDLIAAVKSEDRRGISDHLLGKITAWGDNLLKCRTECGALVNRYDNTELRLKENNLNLTDLQSKISDTDLAEAASQFQMAQAVYQASLAVIAKIVQPTLVDFLR